MRYRIHIVGESGSGLLSAGAIIASALKDAGYYIVADREYPSLIKGGHSCFNLNFSTDPIYSLSKEADVMLALDKHSLVAYKDRLIDGGNLVHGYGKPEKLQQVLDTMNCDVTAVLGREIVREQGGIPLMVNTVLIGVLWKVLGMPYELIEKELASKFGSNPKVLEGNLKCLRAGFEAAEQKVEREIPKEDHGGKERVIVDGNKAIAMGGVQAGVRAYYAYPMSPASSILSYMSYFAKPKGILVKQAEDEITAAQMVVGSMYAGTRAFTATSGGGFDLMTETVSLAGITENPLVIVNVQRPGPGTGLPTWTSQGDLQMVIHSGHGEYAKMIVSVSGPEDAFYLTQEAFNYAEEFQIPVVILSEKVIAETIMSIEKYEQFTVPIKRGLVEGADLEKLENSDRFKITEDGISKRWLPGSADAYYFANGDEHWENGSLSEEEEQNELMYEKRMKKLKTLEDALPEPEVFSNGVEAGADISFVGWGSTKSVMLDVMKELEARGVKVNYLHYSYMYPLKVDRLKRFFEENKNVHLIEGNYNGQLGELITSKAGVEFAGKFLKFNGRPFFVEDLNNYIASHK